MPASARWSSSSRWIHFGSSGASTCVSIPSAGRCVANFSGRCTPAPPAGGQYIVTSRTFTTEPRAARRAQRARPRASGRRHDERRLDERRPRDERAARPASARSPTCGGGRSSRTGATVSPVRSRYAISGQVDAARRRERVPLPEPRVDLHQLEASVARVALELDLRQAVAAERAQQLAARVDDLVDPDGLAEPRGADSGRRLDAACGRRRGRAARATRSGTRRACRARRRRRG